MSFHEDLRRQAWHLARKEPRRPSQASLRRAVSAAYYSLFHLLTDEATQLMFGQQSARRPFRHAIARTFTHQAMKDACRSFSSGNLPQKIRHAIGALPIPPDLRDVATTFVKLQEERHRADYDLAAPFSRMEVLALLGELDGTINAWKRIRTDDMARFFLVALPLWKQF